MVDAGRVHRSDPGADGEIRRRSEHQGGGWIFPVLYLGNADTTGIAVDRTCGVEVGEMTNYERAFAKIMAGQTDYLSFRL